MHNKPKRAKITIELESGDAVSFVAIITTHECPKLEGIEPGSIAQRWNGEKLEPPRWDFEGTTIGAMTMFHRK